jgi:hypothetical protein
LASVGMVHSSFGAQPARDGGSSTPEHVDAPATAPARRA